MDIGVEVINSKSLKATFSEPSDPAGIATYIVSVNESTICTVNARENKECTITELRPANLHTVVVSSCLGDDLVNNCTSADPVKYWTAPSSESPLPVPFYIFISYFRFTRFINKPVTLQISSDQTCRR